jgi:bifunctional non-homologous end joining protein LigD
MSLSEYRRKRRFDRTAEPAPGERLQAQRAIFVVQLHHASRRHYDFRLQVGDALKSWAVPKGPSFDPAVKRMAVEVEDHPVDYAGFEGEIPEGQYGAGHVAIFDRGVWSTDEDAEAQLDKGHLRFELFGERLRGSWHLIRTAARGRQAGWLLVKGQDEFAGPHEADDLLEHEPPPVTQEPPGPLFRERIAALPRARRARIGNEPFPPQLARLADQAPDGEAWLHEVKWDGYRILATVARGRPRLWSRNGIEWTARVPDIVEAVAALGLDSARLDGELIAVHNGHSDFGMLQATLSGERHAPLVYVLFDAPHLQGHDLERTPLIQRKAVLEALLGAQPSRHLRYSTHVVGGGREAFEAASQQMLEGIMSKRVDGSYHGGRGDDWLKIKRLDSDEFAIVGYTEPKGARSGFGSLLLARPDGDGWRYVGRVGSGFSDRLLLELARDLKQHGRSKPTVRIAGIDPLLRGASWVEPSRVAEVWYRGMGRLGLLRQPSLKGLRPDKQAGDLRDADHGPQPAGNARSGLPMVRISNPDRVVFPDRGTTKQQVADYYRAVMDWMLPGVQQRPLSVIRCPGGIGEPCFFQKHMMPGLKRVSKVRLKEEAGSAGDYLWVDGPEALLELVQFGAIEFHPWGSTVAEPDRANRVVFDLDPGPGVAWKRMVAAARRVRDLLEEIGLRSFLRATGGKGLHVVVPLSPGNDWSLVKPFAHAFAESMAQADPDEFVASASKKLRDGRIFIDYLRNGRGATAVASYSLRARPGAPVAVPLRWDELGRLGRPDKFDIASVPRRLARLDVDPWEGIDDLGQDIRALAGATPAARGTQDTPAPGRRGKRKPR